MRREILKGIAAVAIAGVMAVSIPAKSWAQSAADFYKGKTIKWIIPYKPGGGYDKYSRVIAPFFEKHTGARVDIANMPGAGGMKGANEIFSSPKDGLTVGIINGAAMVTNELAGIEGARYKVAEFNFLGRIVADLRVLVTATANKYDTFESLLNATEDVKIGATGLGGSTYVDAVIVGKVFNLKQNVVHGFDSSSDIRAALLRGDVVGMWGSLGSVIKGVKSGDNRIVVQGGQTRSAELPDTPTLYELTEKLGDPAKAKEILDSWAALSEVGRPVATPPGVPEDRVAFLRKAFSDVFADADFQAAAKKAKRELSFETGENMGKIAKAATVLTPEIEALFIAAIKGEL